jgi:hypothetical protein
MATTFRFGVDWNRKGLICWDARPGDALNILPKPLIYSTIDFRKSGVVTSAALQTIETDYGFWCFAVQTGTGVNNGLVLGQEDGTLAVNDIPVNASSPYSVAVWVRGLSGYASVPLVLRVKDQSGATLFASSNFNLSANWQKISVSGSTGAGSTHILIEVVKNNNAADVNFQAVGFMVVSGSVIPNGYNAGHSTNLYDNLVGRVTEANWFLGSHQPYQDDADDSILRLKVKNTDKQYSPEYSSSPLAGFLLPYRPIQVQSNDGTTTRTHVVGWVESIQPTVNEDGERSAEIKAAGAMLFFEDMQTSLALQENKLTSEIITALLQEVVIPPALTRGLFLDVSGYGEVGTTAYLADTVIPNSVEGGKTTLAYAADNWVRRGGSTDEKQDTFNVYRAIKDVAAAERGRFFFDRSGKATFWNRHHLLTDTLIDATFDNTMVDLGYEYAGLGDFKNEVIVSCHPRAISESAEELLWKLDKPINIQPGETRKVTATYRDDSDNRIGGKEVKLANVTFSEGSATIVPEIGANRTILVVTNNSKTKKVVIATCELRGKKITDFGQMEATSRDGVSIAYYGQRTLKMNIPAVDDLDYAQTIADFERARRSQPRGKAKTIKLASHGIQGGEQHAHQLARSVGDLIRIQEAQTAHDETYFIIGEEHRLSQGGTLFESTWYVEPAAEGNWFLVETSKLDEGVLAY